MTAIPKIMLICSLIAGASSPLSAQDYRAVERGGPIEVIPAQNQTTAPAPASEPAAGVDEMLANADGLPKGVSRDIDRATAPGAPATVNGILSQADELAKEVQHDIACRQAADRRASTSQPLKC